MPDGIYVRVTGNDELARKFRAAARDLPETTDRIGLDVADMVAAAARRRVPLGPGANGHVRTSIEGRVVAGLPSVSGGGGRFPYFGWLEFGGHVGIRNSVFRTRAADGRYIYPTTFAMRPQIEDEMADGVQGLLRRHGIGVVG